MLLIYFLTRGSDVFVQSAARTYSSGLNSVALSPTHFLIP